MAKRVLLTCIGIFLAAVGVAFNAGAGFGNDPVGIFYDGIRAALNLSAAALGTASNVVNVALTVLLFFIGRKYVNVGTILYIIPYGTCVSVGTMLYPILFSEDGISTRVFAAVVGCVLLYTGIAMIVTADVGMDPMTGIAMVIADKLHLEFRQAKWIFDGTMTVLGFILGGTLGVITIITALTAGPSIQFIAGLMKKMKRTDAAIMPEKEALPQE